MVVLLVKNTRKELTILIMSFRMVIYQYESERYIVMEKMQEDVFDKIKPTEHPKKCQHEFVKLYHLGTHTDYGCTKCKIKTTTPELNRKIIAD